MYPPDDSIRVESVDDLPDLNVRQRGLPVPSEIKNQEVRQEGDAPIQRGLVNQFLADYDRAFTPTTTYPSEITRELTAFPDKAEPIAEQLGVGAPYRAMRGLQEGTIETTGDIASGMTSPGNLAMLIPDIMSGGAARLGREGLSNALRYAAKVPAGAVVGKGVHDIVDPESTLGQRAEGLFNTLIGGHIIGKGRVGGQREIHARNVSPEPPARLSERPDSFRRPPSNDPNFSGGAGDPELAGSVPYKALPIPREQTNLTKRPLILNPDGTFTDKETGEILDRTGKVVGDNELDLRPVEPEQKFTTADEIIQDKNAQGIKDTDVLDDPGPFPDPQTKEEFNEQGAFLVRKLDDISSVSNTMIHKNPQYRIIKKQREELGREYDRRFGDPNDPLAREGDSIISGQEKELAGMWDEPTLTPPVPVMPKFPGETRKSRLEGLVNPERAAREANIQAAKDAIAKQERMMQSRPSTPEELAAMEARHKAVQDAYAKEDELPEQPKFSEARLGRTELSRENREFLDNLSDENLADFIARQENNPNYQHDVGKNMLDYARNQLDQRTANPSIDINPELPAKPAATNMTPDDIANVEAWYKFKKIYDSGKMTEAQMLEWGKVHNRVKDLKPNGTFEIRPHRFEQRIPPDEPETTPYLLPDGTRVNLSTSATKGAETTSFQLKDGSIVEARRVPEQPKFSRVDNSYIETLGPRQNTMSRATFDELIKAGWTTKQAMLSQAWQNSKGIPANPMVRVVQLNPSMKEPRIFIPPDQPKASIVPSLRSQIQKLDMGVSSDSSYRNLVSPNSRGQLKPGETWRSRALRLADIAEGKFVQPSLPLQPDVLRTNISRSEMTSLWNEMHSLSVHGNREIAFHDAGGRLTPDEVSSLQTNIKFRELGEFADNLINDLLNRVGKGNNVERVFLLFDDKLDGVWVPNPDGTSGIGLNLLSPFLTHKNLQPRFAAEKSVMTAEHESAHAYDDKGKPALIRTGAAPETKLGRFTGAFLEEQSRFDGRDEDHDANWISRLGEIHAALGPDGFFEFANRLKSIVTDKSGNYHPEFQKLLQLYQSSRWRPSTRRDYLSRAGIGAESSRPVPEGTVTGSVKRRRGRAVVPGAGETLEYAKMRIPIILSQKKITAAQARELTRLYNVYPELRPMGAVPPNGPPANTGGGNIPPIPPGRTPPSGPIEPPQDPRSKDDPSLLREVWNLSRGIMSTDLPFITSAALRQGLRHIGSGPWFKAWYASVRAYGSEKMFRANELALRNQDIFRNNITLEPEKVVNGRIIPAKKISAIEQAGVRFSKMDGDLSGRDEQIRSSLAEKIPLLGRHIRASNRGFSAFVNTLRTGAFNNLYQHMAQSGQFPNRNFPALKAMGDWVNNTTGSGNLSTRLPFRKKEFSLERYAQPLAEILFSPRLIAQNLQSFNPYNYFGMPKGMRLKYWESMARLATAWSTFAILAKMGGADVELDPRSADFGKIKIGNTRFDPAAGLQQFLVLATKEVSGQYISSNRPNKVQELGGSGPYDQTRGSVASSFVGNKLHPSAAFLKDFAFATKKQPIGIGNELLESFTPMIISDLKELIDSGKPEMLMFAPLISAGWGTQTYDRTSRNEGTYFNPKQDPLGKFEGGSLTGR